jgi:hypothetical protein
MFLRNLMNRRQRDGYKQGFMTALLITSPFIVAGIKWMMDNSEPMVKQMKNVTDSDLYTQFFDKQKHEEKSATRKLQNMRANEGNFHIEAADHDDDAQLFKMIKEITKNELAKRDSNS